MNARRRTVLALISGWFVGPVVMLIRGDPAIFEHLIIWSLSFGCALHIARWMPARDVQRARTSAVAVSKAPMSAWILIGALCGVIAVWLIMWWAASCLNPKLSDRGVFGDSFGFVNSLFSGLALAGIFISIIYQRQELAVTRDELAETLETQKAQVAIANDTYKLAITPMLVPGNTTVGRHAFRNVGEGPALNVRLFRCPGHAGFPEFAKAVELGRWPSVNPRPDGTWDVDEFVLRETCLFIKYHGIDHELYLSVSYCDRDGKVAFDFFGKASEKSEYKPQYQFMLDFA